LSEREEIEEIEEIAEEPSEREAAVEETEEELPDLLIGLDQINTMIQVTELWDRVVSGGINIDEAKKLLDRISGYTRRQAGEEVEEEYHEAEESEETVKVSKKAKTSKKAQKTSKKKPK
jgi:hypothetical protein